MLLLRGEKYDLIKEGEEKQLAINMLYNFAEGGAVISTRNNTESDIKIVEIQTETLEFDFDDSDAVTRSASVPSNTKANLYIFTFEKDDKKGFSVVSSDDRFPKVFAYTENGSLSDTTYIEGLNWMINRIPSAYKEGVYNYYMDTVTTTRAVTIYLDIPNLTVTKWSQGGPYNSYAPLMSDGCRAYAGCTSIACAQVLAMMNPSYLNSYNFNLYALSHNSGSIYLNDPLANDVARFVYYIGNNWLGTKYGCVHNGGSGAWFKDIRSLLNACKISYTYNDGNLNYNSLASGLSIGWPVLACGTQKKGKKEGHSWVYSGIRGTLTAGASGVRGNYIMQSVTSIYCNWGWGGTADGWYYGGSHEHPTNQADPYLADNEQIYFTNHTPNPEFTGEYTCTAPNGLCR